MFVRAFVAIKVPNDVRRALHDMQTTLKEGGTRVSWVPPSSFNLSLAFLGDRLERLAETRFGDVPVLRIHMRQSHLPNIGTTYTALYSAPLQAGRSA